MDSIPITNLLGILREKELLSAQQLDEIAKGPLKKTADARALAQALVQQGWLTTFQVNQLLQGKGHELVLGTYRLLDRIGGGGMGEVFKAQHRLLNRTVALKIMRKDKMENEVAKKRFFREVNMAAQLIHPHIVVAYDAGQVGETYYFAMEYVNGTTLYKLVKRTGPLPIGLACEFIRQAAEALQYAHERTVVHRDIKPGNLLVGQLAGAPDSPPVVKVLDMGLARLTDPNYEQSKITKIGSIVGTPEYLAPEQAMDSHEVDARADLYSLGCTFYSLLAGQPPFKGSLLEVLTKHRMVEPPRVKNYRPEVTPQLSAILEQLLQKRPADRYQNAAELATALKPFCTKDYGKSALALLRSINDQPAPRPEPAPPPAKPEPTITTANKPPAAKKPTVGVKRKKSNLLMILGGIAVVIVLIDLLAAAVALFLHFRG